MNLIEGGNRLNTKEYRRLFGIAKGSTGEISCQVLLARDLGYFSEETCAGLANRYKIVIKMLSNLAKSLDKRSQQIILLLPSPFTATGQKKMLDNFF
jgi:four helix bundle protein